MSSLYQPWMPPSTSLIARGMEVVIPPGQLPPADRSPTSMVFGQNTERHDADQYEEYHRQTVQTVNTSASYDIISRPDLDSKRAHSSPEAEKMALLRHSSPQMSQSTRKVLQLAGFDPRCEETFRYTHSQQEVSPRSSGSSESVYSQPEGAYVDAKTSHVNSWRSAPAALTSVDDRSTYLQPSVHSASERRIVPSSTTRTGRTASQRRRDYQKKIENSDNDANNNHTTESSTIQGPQIPRHSRFGDGFEHDLNGQYNHELTDVGLAALVPRRLVIRTKPKKPQQQAEEKLSFFANARDSLNWGIDALTSPKTQHFNSAVTPILEEESISPRGAHMPPPPKAKHKRFGNGNHPLKSPFPFGLTYENSDPGESGQKFMKRFSGAIRRVFGAGRFSPTKTTVIPNSQRAYDGPDTPLPLKSPELVTFVDEEVMRPIGNLHFQEVAAKAKQGLAVRTADEKRRESLKKKIMVIGTTDQSPGMYLLFFLLSLQVDADCV
jgi:hypothetical protein